VKTFVILMVCASFASTAFGVPFLYAAEKDAAVVSVSYKNQSFSPEFIDWIAKFGAKKKFVVGDQKSIADIVSTECGSTGGQNVDLFRKALGEEIALEPGREILTPPCLPVLKIELAPRIVGPKDNIWSYLKELPQTEFGDRQIKTYSAENPPGTGTVIDAMADADGMTSLSVTSDDKVVYDNIASIVPQASSHEYKQIIANYWQTRNVGIDNESVDVGKLAYDAALVKDAFRQGGVDIDTSEIVKAGLPEVEMAGRADTSKIVVAIADGAENRWNANFGKNVELAAKVAGTTVSNGQDFMKNVVWLEPGAGQNTSRDPSELQVGDFVIAPSIAVQNVQLPIDKGYLMASVPNTPVPDPYVDDQTTAELAELDTFHVDEILGTDQCTATDKTNWGSQSFVNEFRQAVLRNRIAMIRGGKNEVAATVVIADSGFVIAENRTPLEESLFADSGTLKNQAPASAFDDTQRAHGTAVAGLAIGGPMLWPLARALGIDIKISPTKIFDARTLSSGKTVPFLVDQALKNAATLKGDIYNLSFGSRNQIQMENFKNSFVTKFNDKLFVIAAGNNNLNDSDQGVDIELTTIYPQYWGGNDTGYNMLVVAALDGGELAHFSNYSSTRVSFAAPGCRVNSWKPTDADRSYAETPVSGTSFSAPIVSYVAAIVKAMSPSEKSAAPFLRARLIAASDLTSAAAAQIEHGRVFNPVKAVSLYEDVVELVDDDQLKFGRLQWSGELNDICEGGQLPAESTLLKIARDPTAQEPRFVYYYMRDYVLNTVRTCNPRTGAAMVLLREDGTSETIAVDNIKDIVFRY
jgi:subtilisin family serine protease